MQLIYPIKTFLFYNHYKVTSNKKYQTKVYKKQYIFLSMRKRVKKENLKNNKFNHPIIKVPKTVGQKAADWITKWAGSWVFIFLFFIFLGLWMFSSGLLFLKYTKGDFTDPYPFILLNLILSCLAAIQAPVILMSQNRSAQRDRLRTEYDYAVNRKAEREIQEIKKLLMKKK